MQFHIADVFIGTKYTEVRSYAELNEFTILTGKMEITKRPTEEGSGNGFHGSGFGIDTKTNKTYNENLQTLGEDKVLSQDEFITTNDDEGKILILHHAKIV